jgi:hypothetical protein
MSILKKIILFICFCIPINAQQIITLSHFQPHYNITDKTISLDGGELNILKQFLHELGHHIWFYGGIDTVAYKQIYKDDSVQERFAWEHYWYFTEQTDNYHKKIFDNFYNKESK